MAKRSPDNKQHANLNNLPEMEINTASWFLPGNPDTSDIYPTMYIREPHDVVGFNIVAKTPGTGSSTLRLDRANLSGNDIIGWTTVGSFSILGNDHIADSDSLVESDVSEDSYYRLVPTTINGSIRNVTASIKYRKKLVTED